MSISLTPEQDAQLIKNGTRARKAAYLREWYARPENKGKKRAYAKRHQAKHGEAVRIKSRERSRHPDKIAQRKAYRAQPEIKEKLRLYELSRTRRMAYLQRRYGISATDKQTMLHTQGNRCAICPKPLELTSSHVDHCHHTKKVRGILCADCNRALGLFRDNPDLLINAALYLQASLL